MDEVTITVNPVSLEVVDCKVYPSAGILTCLRDLKMDLARENFDKGQISREVFEQEIQRADRVCVNCEDPVCRFPRT
ncbi:MAG: hypothetical protein IMZ61_11585 [Planctomycetes bacterium]|nr:hypothetical protein [Planctomycetota bacterium]